MLYNAQTFISRLASVTIHKKWRHEIVLAFLVLVFLQLFLCFIYVGKYIISISPRSQEIQNTYVTHEAMIKHLLDRSLENNVPLFLIEPSNLGTYSNLSEALDGMDMLTFGINGNDSTIKEDWIPDILSNDHVDIFKSFCNPTIPVAARVIYNMTDIPCHYFMHLSSYGLTYHLIVFHTRGSNFTWSDEVRIQNGSQPYWLELDRLEFGNFPVSFKSLETENRRIGDIVVPVGKYVKNFKNNRFIECDYTRANRYLKNNNISSKTRNSYVTLRMHKLLSKASAALNAINVDFWLSSGTLLGWYRECGIIQHTTDVDIEVNITQYSNKIVDSFKKHDFYHLHTFGAFESSYEYSFLWHNTKIDLFFAYENDASCWVGGTLSNKRQIKYVVPKFTLCWTELIGLQVRIPCQTDKYIEATYGQNWNKPRKNWLWNRDASNIQRITRRYSSTTSLPHIYHMKYRQSNKPRAIPQIQNLSPTQTNAIKLFIHQIKKRKINVFLIQPPKGKARDKVITFGVKGTQEVVTRGLISKKFTKGDAELFTLLCNPAVYLPARRLYKMSEIPCHIFVHHKRTNATYHVIVFHAKGDNFMWSDEVDIRNRLHPPWFKINHLVHGEYPVSFKNLETENRLIGNMVVPEGKYVKNFKNNRFIECDYTRANLYLKQHNITTDVNTKRNAQKFMKMLREAAKALEKLGVEFWLSSGTLLGWYRECGIIPYTTDIDIEIKISQFSNRILPTLQRHGFFHGFTFGKLEAGFQYSFYWQKIKLDVFFAYEDKNSSWIGGALPDHTKIKFVVPKFSLCWAELLGFRVRVPCQTDKYIEATYGKNWNKPTKQWLWYRDAFNVQRLPIAKSYVVSKRGGADVKPRPAKRLINPVSSVSTATKEHVHPVTGVSEAKNPVTSVSRAIKQRRLVYRATSRSKATKYQMKVKAKNSEDSDSKVKKNDKNRTDIIKQKPRPATKQIHRVKTKHREVRDSKVLKKR